MSKVDNHVDKGVARLLQQFQGSPNLISLLSSYLKQVQTFEDAFFPMLDERDVEQATGDRLDQIGQILLIRRAGRSDTDYRNALKVEIQILSSRGNFSDVYALINTVMPGATTFDFLELFPKTIYITPTGNYILLEDPVYVAESIRRAVTVGTHVLFVYQLVPDAELYLTSSQLTVSESSGSIGLAPTDQSAGGKLAGAA